jgi:MYXO-CTERM domain-containing protein
MSARCDGAKRLGHVLAAAALALGTGGWTSPIPPGDDAGGDAVGDAGSDAGDDAGDPDPTGIQPTTTPDNYGCRSTPGDGPSGALALLLAATAVGALAARRRRVRAGILASALLAPIVLSSTYARADAEASAAPAVAPELSDAPLGARGEARRFALSWNPFTLHLERASLNLEVLARSHHVAVITLFGARTKTNEDSYENVFEGLGGELGYRWYSGHDGPRGLYVGPSLLLARFWAVPARGETIPFWNLGLAVDVGWQAIVADRWVVGVGAGAQYTVPTASFPAQELPASVYAIRGLRPRLLMALGYAF